MSLYPMQDLSALLRSASFNQKTLDWHESLVIKLELA